MQGSGPFVTQSEIREAGRAEDPDIHRWVALALMPAPRRYGRKRWPAWAMERARWLREQLERGVSLPQLGEVVRHGVGVPSAPLLDAPASAAPEPVQITLDSLGLRAAERRLCEAALERGGSLMGAAALLGITRHALRRLMVKHGL